MLNTIEAQFILNMCLLEHIFLNTSLISTIRKLFTISVTFLHDLVLSYLISI